MEHRFSNNLARIAGFNMNKQKLLFSETVGLEQFEVGRTMIFLLKMHLKINEKSLENAQSLS